MDFWQRYRAIDARDTRFDGQFYTAVRTTGIYCRPSCPARTPKAENVTFYETSAAAHDAGYRACKRCLPEAVPGTPAWNIRSDIAGRAMRLINDGVINRDGVEGLAVPAGLLLTAAQPDPQPRTRRRSAVAGPGQPGPDRPDPAGVHRR